MSLSKIVHYLSFVVMVNELKFNCHNTLDIIKEKIEINQEIAKHYVIISKSGSIIVSIVTSIKF